MNYKNSCRICLGAGKDMHHKDDTIIISNENVCISNILEKFYECKLSEDDANYPDSICITCVHHLTLTFSFKKLIESSTKKLEESCGFLEDSANDLDDDFNYEDTVNDDDYSDEDYEEKPKLKKKMVVKTSKRTTNKRYTSSNTRLVVRKNANNRQVLKRIKKEEKKPRLFCVECKAEFNSTVSLKEHCTNTHPVKCIVGRDCEYCNEKFDDFRSLVLHKKLHAKPYICENCWDGFYEMDNYNTHSCLPKKEKGRYKIDNDADRPLRQCDQCGKSYPPGYIKIHLLTHSDHRAYSCKYCPKKFKVPGSLNSHVLWAHKRTRNHTCEVCNAAFISASAKSAHLRKNHLKETKYSCESCGKRFFSKSELHRHALTHTGVKDYHCHMCDKSYQTRYGLNVHLKSHSQMNMNVLHM